MEATDGHRGSPSLSAWPNMNGPEKWLGCSYLLNRGGCVGRGQVCLKDPKSQEVLLGSQNGRSWHDRSFGATSGPLSGTNRYGQQLTMILDMAGWSAVPEETKHQMGFAARCGAPIFSNRGCASPQLMAFATSRMSGSLKKTGELGGNRHNLPS